VLIWRYHAEVGMASIASPASLGKAAAALDEFAAGFPEDQRFRLHFAFMVDPPDGMGPGCLSCMAV
jgi:hypothetical protein